MKNQSDDKPEGVITSALATCSVAFYVEYKEDDGSWAKMNEADPTKCTDEFMRRHNFNPTKWRITKVTTDVLWPPSAGAETRPTKP